MISIYIYVIDSELKSQLLSQNYKLVTQKTDINNKTIWVFDDCLNRFCFERLDPAMKAKCFTRDRLTLSF